MFSQNGKGEMLKYFGIVGLASILLVSLGIYLYRVYADIEIKNYGNADVQRLSQTVEERKKENETVTQMIENATNSVVGISKIKNIGETVFSKDGVSQMGIGSGVIVSESGFILTNEHVSGGKGSSCFVTMEDGKDYNASVIWSDSSLDLSIIRINMKCINYAKLGDSDMISVGESVYAIGNPIGFEFQKTVTSGIISALNRTINFKENDKEVYMSNLIQTDATINPGNSGGPLINVSGEIVGINTVKITSAEGIGFAVPINIVKPIISKLESEGKFDEPSIGIFAYDKNVIPYLNSNIKFDTGIYVAQVSLDSVAYRSGLQVGDIITKIDDKYLEKMCDLREYVYSKNVGDVVNLEILRNNKKMNLQIKLVRK